MDEVICFVPELNNCTSYREGTVSATLCTKYHYGCGGDAALIMYTSESNNAPQTENQTHDIEE